jgi:hypothetical protein
MTLKIRGSGGMFKLLGTNGSFKVRAMTNNVAFDPLSLGNLSAWYKADTLALSNGATVTEWTDSSGTGNSLDLYSGTPIYNSADAEFNGMPSVSFDGSSYLYKSSPALPTGAAAFTLYVVGYAIDTEGFDSLFGWGSNYFNGRVQASGAGIVNSIWAEYGSSVAAFTTPTFGVPIITSISMPASGIRSATEMYTNNIAGTVIIDGLENTSLNIGDATVTIGTTPGALSDSMLDGKIAEGLIYSVQHTNSERLQVTQYLASKYGISI